MSNTGISTTLAGRDSVGITALLYQAGLERLPDGGGLTFFVNQLEAGSLSPVGLANFITTSPEFVSTHTGQSRSEIINDFYQNILGRDADASGLEFYTNSTKSLGEILADISLSNEAVMRNDVGLHRFELAALNGQVSNSGTADLDNTPTPPTVIEVPVPGPGGGTVLVPTPVDTMFINANAQAGPNGLNPDGTLPFGAGNFSLPGHLVEVHGGGQNDLQIFNNSHIRQANDPHLYNRGTLNPDGSVTYNVYGGPQTTATGSQSNNTNRSGTNTDIFISTDASPLIPAGKTMNDYDILIKIDKDVTAGVDFVTYKLEHSFDPTGANTPFLAQGGYVGGITDSAGGDNKTFAESFNWAFLDTDATTAGQQALDLNTLAGAQLDVVIEVYNRDTVQLVGQSVTHFNMYAAGDPAISYA